MDNDNPYRTDEEDFKAAQGMDKITKTVFAPIYPMIAQQIKEEFNITKGICVDLGSGPAALSINLARITDLRIHAIDASKHSFKIATDNIKEQEFEDQIIPVLGSVEDMPFEDNFADIIVSRGSIFFWDDLNKAFNEIFRILKPGGKTAIGGGFGSAEMKEKIFAVMAKKDDKFVKKSKGRLSPENIERIKNAIENSDIEKYDIYHGDKGFWIHITKE